MGWAVTLILFLSFANFPVPAPDNKVDGSLGQVLAWAQQTEQQFGKDLVITYGPLGHLVFFYYSSQTAAVRWTVDVALGLVVAFGIWLMARRMGRWWGAALVAAAFCILPNVPARADTLINVGLFCWGWVTLLESGRKLRLSAAVLAALAAFAALAKISFLFGATAGVALVAIGLWMKGERKVGSAAAGFFVLLFVLGWTLSGQELLNLPDLLRNEASLVGAYHAALGEEGIEPVIELGFLILGLTLGAALPGWPASSPALSWWRRAPGILFSGFLTFAAFKHGLVREQHAIFFFAFAPIAALVLAGLNSGGPWRRWAGRGCALAAVVLSFYTLQRFLVINDYAMPVQSVRTAITNARIVGNPAGWMERMDEGLQQNRRLAQLPKSRDLIGPGRVDVFGQSQGYALWNDLKYRPRPVFQSYVACNRRLRELNEAFYQSKHAPDYVLFELAAMDRKYPALEDARVLRHLLINYRPVTNEGEFLLLAKHSREAPRMRLLRQGIARPGESFDLLGAGESGVWVEVEAEPSFWGRLRSLALRPAILRVAFRGEGSVLLRRNRAPASMLADGFVASPMLTRTDDLLKFYRGERMDRPRTCSVEVVKGEEWLWDAEIRYRVYAVDNIRSGTAGRELREEAARPFTLFRSTAWRPERLPPTRAQEALAYLVFLTLPLACAVALWRIGRKVKEHSGRISWPWVVAWNLGLLSALVSLLLLGGETYFRFFYDTTDSLSYTRVSERWVQRHWEVNEAGSRDNLEYAPKIEAGKRRVTFVGDSFTAGHGVPNVDDRFLNLIRRSQPGWEVHSAAAVGLDTGGHLKTLQRAFEQGYEVDTVVLVYCLNDIGDLMAQQQEVWGRLLGEVEQSGFLTRNSYFLNLMYHRFNASNYAFYRDYGAVVRVAYEGELWPRQKERFAEFKRLVESHGGRLVVVTFPFLHALGDGYQYAFVHQQLKQAWEELGVPNLDLLPVFSAMDPAKVTVNSLDAHPNELAQRMARAAIEPWLVQQIGAKP